MFSDDQRKYLNHKTNYDAFVILPNDLTIVCLIGLPGLTFNGKKNHLNDSIATSRAFLAGSEKHLE